MTQSSADPRLAAARRALQEGAYDQAIEAFESILAAYPAEIDALRGIAEAYRYFNRGDRVVELYELAAAHQPDDPDISAGFVEALIANADLARARAQIDAAIAAHPENLRLKLLLAQIEMIEGNRDAARQIFWSSLETDSENTDCLYHLADIAPDDELQKLGSALAPAWVHKDERDPWDAASLGYAYGKTAERQREFDKAWKGFSFGAKQKRSIVRFDEQTYARTHDAHRQTFASSSPSPLEQDLPGRGFVFIASLPRSGSTLVERILDAHKDVEAIGERSFVYDTVTYWHKTYGPDPIRLFSEEAIKDTGAHYIEKARGAASGPGAVIVDKSITNYLFLGFLRIVLPGARFVHVARHPLDTAISCFSTLFFAGNEWTYDFGEIGRNLRRHQKIMRYWFDQWPDDIQTVPYEELVTDPERWTRDLVSFCRLDWDPACLTFHESDRPVLTASLNQVRQPIYSSAKGRHAPYQKYLEPLMVAMGKRAADPNWIRTSKEN